MRHLLRIKWCIKEKVVGRKEEPSFTYKRCKRSIVEN